jgi:hypothetical protein
LPGLGESCELTQHAYLGCWRRQAADPLGDWAHPAADLAGLPGLGESCELTQHAYLGCWRGQAADPLGDWAHLVADLLDQI